MSVVELADGRIVLERLFGHFEFGIDYHLEGVKTGIDVGDVDPLAINVVGIGIGAVDGNALVAVIGALEERLLVVGALVVLQTERSFVSLGHFDAV